MTAEPMENSGIKTLSMQHLGPVMQTLLSDNSPVKITVTGNSMYPLLRSGRDEVVLTRCANPKKGDIVFYKRNTGEYILHRIVGKKNGAFYLAGDAEVKKEYPILPEQIIGTAVSITSRGREISCKNPIYSLYYRLWTLLLPRRADFIHIYMKIRAITGGRRKTK